jgi:hypothetical protein
VSLSVHKGVKLSIAPSRRPGFGPRSSYARFVVDNAALGQCFRNTWVPLPILSPPTVTYSLIILSWMVVVSFTVRPAFPGGNNPCTHRIGGGVMPRAGIDAMNKTKVSTSGNRTGNSRSPTHSLVTILTELHRAVSSWTVRHGMMAVG